MQTPVKQQPPVVPVAAKPPVRRRVILWDEK